MNEDNNIYDVEKYEDVTEEKNEEIVEDHIEEDYIEEDYVEKDYVKEDYIEEDRAYEKDSYVHPINNLSKKPKKKKKGGIFKVIALSLITGLLGGAIGSGSVYYIMKGDKSSTSNGYTGTPNPATFDSDVESLTASQAFDKVAPAVVIVSVSGVVDYSGIIPKETEGIGSGFIINEEGYILTNYHVIEGAKEVTVTLSDGREVKAKVINYDENQDVAMLKISD
ncbi:MAG: trypsin-like peptidase domain-containing protein, partial [Clostridium sp.]|nr:trypsin-like peptidase domain-containing protein [Clostridium sp.]